MDKQKTVIINGVHYDAHTGMRVEGQAAAKVALKVDSMKRPIVRSTKPSTTLHTKSARTHTLSRKHVRVPVKKSTPVHAISTHKIRPQTAAVHNTTSPMVQRFARDVSAPIKSSSKRSYTNTVSTPDIAPTTHPLQHHVKVTKAAAQPTVASKQMSATEQKHHAIAKAMQQAAQTKKQPKIKKQKKSLGSFFAKRPRFAAVASASLAVVILGGYLTYINLPNISVRVAAAQAGIAAVYPSYRPSGYSLSGPVAYSDGKVSMKFAANAGPQNFTVNQVKSNWDSSALLDNYVYDASAGEYDTYKNAGLTVYTYGNNAAWVNDGILHTIKGDASLTNDQIRKIATSM